MKYRLLLVEDDFEMLEYTAALLSENYQIIKARNGKDALKKLEIEPIQLIVSDIMMPLMDGMELCRVVKTNIEYFHIPFILLTAKNTIQAKVDGLELGADAYIEKPFSKEYLVAQIGSLLKNRETTFRYFSDHPSARVQPGASTPDELFLKKLNEVIDADIAKGTLDTESLAEKLNMSRMSLYRRIKSITSLSPIEYISIIRLRKAAELLASGKYKVYEVCYMMGFSSQSNFARVFSKHYQLTPTEYMQSFSKKTDSTD
ncbi:MAG: response regulator [Bacteroidetes bacterium]|nr:response regulator [Bacteroidota bacterium]